MSVVAALVVVGSCVSHIPKNAIPPVVCTTGEYLDVDNETGQVIDVYALRGASMLLLGTVGTGRSTLALPNSSSSGLAFAGYLHGTRMPLSDPEDGKPKTGHLDLNPRCR